MKLADYNAYPEADKLMTELAQYDLMEHVVELEAYGFTIVPPEKMQSSSGFIERLRDAIIRTSEERNDIKIGDVTTTPPENVYKNVYKNSWDLLEEDEVFVEAAINPVVLTLTRWLLGQSAIFSGQTWVIKGQGASGLGLHNDAHGIPPGAGQIAHMCNASWICTDYDSSADGPTVFVPGSHHRCAPLPHEPSLAETPYKVVPLIAKAGSLAIWNGATWHASEARTNPGLRVTLVQFYMRSYMGVQNNYEDTSPQLLKKYPELERVIGKSFYPFKDRQNTDPSRIGPFMRAGTDPLA
ncbi:phytanoyl-CoA dioxygenase family protein [Pseudomonadales bacterium]|nr:phytanoyl-CoA dioxygenase family protein [Pseudomonadales bacterium]MDC1328750.1 phytanoyl-CoA dioxygenase family protein [Pseudomonadales bacterium]MDC3343979.1 phytanoyl-CoA dioxygenase family protein [Pseudomonadales bacterium]